MGRLRVLLGDPDSRSRNRIKKMLTADGYLVVAEADEGMGVLRYARTLRPDVAVLSEDLQGLGANQVIAVLMDDRICPAILMAASGSAESLLALKNSGALGVVARPVQKSLLVATMELAVETFRRLGAKEDEIETLKIQLENRKTIEKAKGVLMQRMKLTEAEAYRHLQVRSMNQKVPMAQIAQAILLAFETTLPPEEGGR